MFGIGRSVGGWSRGRRGGRHGAAAGLRCVAAAVMVAAVVVAVPVTAVAQSQRFPDVPPDHYAFEAVEWAAEVGVTTGYTDGTFKPERPLSKRHAVVFLERYYDEILQAEESEDFTRGDMMVLLKAINDGTLRDTDTEAESPSEEGASQRFPDVSPDHYAFEAVEWAAEVGVTTGYTDGTFKPERPLSKRHAVVFLERYYDEILQAEESEDFTRGDMMVLLKAINDGTIKSGDSSGAETSGGAAVVTLLNALTVAAEHTSGYDRDLFKHWTDEDGDGCDTRREVLLAEAVVAPTQGSRCSLADGEWISRYDGLTEQGNGRGFDVDHLVPLAEAWESGAHNWTADRRERYANDLGYEHSLIAVSARSNRSKGAQDPAAWLPPEGDQHCWYAAAWVHVKTRWSLTVDTAEVNTLEGILSDCSDSAIDVDLPAPVVQEQDTTEQETDSTTDDSTTQTPQEDCHPAYTPCLPNLPGDALNCGDLTSDQKPVTVNEIGVDPYRLDRDGDGRGCAS